MSASDFTARLGELAAEHGLDAIQVQRLLLLLGGLMTMERVSTTVRGPAEAVNVHIADSLTALGLEQVREARSAVDLGAGAGFPGLPLAVALPGCEFTLLESVRWRCEGIRELAGLAGITTATPLCLRAESWPAGRGRADLVTARALAPLAVLCEYAAPLLRPGGALVAWKGARDRLEDGAALRAAAELGLELGDVVRTHPYPGSMDHHLHVYLKVRATPDRYPRRPGIARKRPLGGST